MALWALHSLVVVYADIVGFVESCYRILLKALALIGEVVGIIGKFAQCRLVNFWLCQGQLGYLFLEASQHFVEIFLQGGAEVLHLLFKIHELFFEWLGRNLIVDEIQWVFLQKII